MNITELRLLLRIHVDPEPIPSPIELQPGLTSLETAGAIQKREGESTGLYQTTAMGHAWLKAMCKVPAPTKREFWVDEKDEIL